MLRSAIRRAMASAAALSLIGGVVACREDLPDPGDDLLSGSRWGGTLAGATKAGAESSRTFFHAPAGGQMSYVVNFLAGEHLDETSAERLDELHQTVASLEFE